MTYHSLRNKPYFIINQKVLLYPIILFIDFSDWQFQPKEYDLVRFLLFWAAIFPYDKFQEKATMFFDSYNQLFAIDYSLIQKFLHPAIVEFDTRRKKYNRKKAIITAEPDKNRQWISEIITKQI